MNAGNSQSARLALLQRLGEGGHRIFTPEVARSLLGKSSASYVNQILHSLTRHGWLVRQRRGLYALSPNVFQGAPMHEFELAVALVKPAALSHWSALSIHELTEQVPHEVFVLTTAEASLPYDRVSGGQLCINGSRFRFCQVKPEHFFGIETIWRGGGDTPIPVTDPERTLLDGLARPQYCGDFGLVYEAFERRRSSLHLDRIIGYALRLGPTSAKRLGWILERIGLPPQSLERLAALPIRGYRPLDPTALRRGPCNSKWNIIENLPGRVSR